LTQLDLSHGSTASVQPRLQTAQAALESQRIRPMRLWQRLLVLTTFFGALLILPIGFGVSILMTLSPFAERAEQATQTADAFMQKREALNAELARNSKQLSLAEIVRELAGDGATAASTVEIEAAESKLGQPLPAELKQVYAISRSVPDLIGAPKELRILPNFNRWEEMRAYQEDADYEVDFEQTEADADSVEAEIEAGIASTATGDGDPIWFTPVNGGSERQIKLNQAAPLLKLNREGALLFDLSATPLNKNVRVYSLDMTLAPDLLGLLRSRWAQLQLYKQEQLMRQAAIKTRAAAFLNRPTTELLALSQPKIPWMYRMLIPAQDVPKPATEVAITQLHARLQRNLPLDHQTLLRTQNGVPMMQLLASAKITPMSGAVKSRPAFLGQLNCAMAAPCPTQSLQPESLDRCIIVAGHANSAKLPLQYATLLWCPELAAAHQYVDSQRQSYRSLNEWMAWRAGAMAALD
jgi:cell wall assembly regulator SMI1